MVASLEVSGYGGFLGDSISSYYCQLESNGAYIGGTTVRSFFPEDQLVVMPVAITGGAYFAPGSGGGGIGASCSAQDGSGFAQGQIMITKIAGFL